MDRNGNRKAEKKMKKKKKKEEGKKEATALNAAGRDGRRGGGWSEVGVKELCVQTFSMLVKPSLHPSSPQSLL